MDAFDAFDYVPSFLIAVGGLTVGLVLGYWMARKDQQLESERGVSEVQMEEQL